MTLSLKCIDGRRRRRQRNRERCIEAARFLTEVWFRGGSFPTAERIAAEAGVSLRSVFAYFGTREGILSALVRAHPEILDAFETALNQRIPPEYRIHGLLRMAWTQSIHDPEQECMTI